MWVAGTQLFGPPPAASRGACQQEAGIRGCEAGVGAHALIWDAGVLSIGNARCLPGNRFYRVVF